MAKALSSPILQLIHQVALDQHLQQLSDHDLVQSFKECRDEAAFNALLIRHGPMVLDVCRGVLANEADVEDAFQATFLLLARKAASIRKTSSVGSWLHGVAYRTGLKALAQSATRKKNELRVPGPQACEPDDLSWREVRQVLHEELTALAERYRAPLVGCYLEGMTQDEAAAHLGMATSTLKERLERGRSLLRARLVRRGLGPMAALLATAWPSAAASACLPGKLLSDTIKAADLFAAGQTATAGLISNNVVALAEGVLRTMFAKKLKALVAAVMLGVLACAGIGVVINTAGVRAQNKSARKEVDQLPPAKGDEAAPKEGVAELQGKWQAVSIETYEGNTPESIKLVKVDTKGLWMTLDGEKMVRPGTGADGKPEPKKFKVTFETDNDPPRLTLHIKKENDARKIHYIYEVKGDTLRLCSFDLLKQDLTESVGIPTKFSLDDDPKNPRFPRLEVWKRVKEEGKKEPVEPYVGFKADQALLRKHLIHKSKDGGRDTRASSAEACEAAQRIFSRVPFLYRTRDEVLGVLGDPATISDYNKPAGKDPASPLVYVFDSGRGGYKYTIRFGGLLDGVRVRAVEVEGQD